MDVSQLDKRLSRLRELRSSVEEDWEKCCLHAAPQLAISLGIEPRGRRRSQVVDGTAMEAVDALVAGLDAFIFRGDVFRVAPAVHIQPDQAMVEWGNAAAADMELAVNHRHASWATARLMALRALIGVGTCCIFAEDVLADRHLRFSAIPIGEIYVAENASGMVDTLFREYELTALQARDEFGASVLPSVIAADIERGDVYNTHTIYHAVFPADHDTDGKKRRGFVCYYYHLESKTVLRESQYQIFPFFVGRYERVNGSSYGWTPTMTALDEILRVNDMGRTNLRVAHQLANPSLYLRNGMFSGRPINRNPGAINYYDATAAVNEQEVKQFPTGTVTPWMQEQEEGRRQQIRQSLAYYLLQVPQANMTATEWIGRQGEIYRRLGGVASQVAREIGDNLARWTLMALLRAGVITPPPAPYRITDFDVYIEPPIYRMEAAESMDKVLRFGQSLQIPAQADPGSLSRVDFDAMVKRLAEISGIPPGIIRSDKVVSQIRQQQQQQQEVQQLIQSAAPVAGAVEKIAKVPGVASGQGGGLRALIG